jgi:hypothetical protein
MSARYAPLMYRRNGFPTQVNVGVPTLLQKELGVPARQLSGERSRVEPWSSVRGRRFRDRPVDPLR